MIHFAAIASPINDIADSLGANNLPYAIPLHPNLVHLTIGLFAIAIAFDVAGAFYPLEKRVFRYLALPVTRSGFHDVGWCTAGLTPLKRWRTTRSPRWC